MFVDQFGRGVSLLAGRVALFLSFLAYEVERCGLMFLVIGSDDQQTGAFIPFLLLKVQKVA